MSTHSRSVSALEVAWCRHGSGVRATNSATSAASRAQRRTNGADLANPMRIIGNSVGGSAAAVLAGGVQTIHAQLAKYGTPFCRARISDLRRRFSFHALYFFAGIFRNLDDEAAALFPGGDRTQS